MKGIMKRIGVLFMAAAVALTFTPLVGGLAGGPGGGPEVYALEDTTPPELDVSSIHYEILGTDRTVATAGDTVRIYANITDDTAVSYLNLSYSKPSGNEAYPKANAARIDDTDTWYWDFEITEDSESGLWRFYALRVEDQAGNLLWYMNKNVYNDPNPRDYDRYLDIQGGAFEVEGTNGDVEPPVIDLSTLKASPAFAYDGDTVKVSVKITDNRGVDKAYVWIKRPDGNTDAYNTVPMTYNSSTNKWEFELPVSNSTMKGTWVVWYLEAVDVAELKTRVGKDPTKALATFHTNVPKKINPVVKLSTAAYIYNGKARKPGVTVKDGSTKLKASQYTVTFASGRKNVGKYSVKVKLKGIYSGSKTVYFKIYPKGTSLKTLTKASKAITVKWSKQSAKMATSRITGYQILLATDSAFTQNKKTVNVKGYKNTSKKVKKLKGKKKYYVKVRTYKTIDGTKYYSPWSDVMKVTTKK